MRRWFLLIVSAVAVGAVLPSVPASAAPPPPDSVNGQVVVVQFPGSIYGTHIRVDARSGPSGQNPTGTIDIYQCLRGSCGAIPPEVGGAVTCLNVQGNRAILGYYGPVYESPFFGVGRYRIRGLIEVVDNGPPSERGDRLTDEAEYVYLDTPEPDVPFTTCPATLPDPPGTVYDPFPPPPSPDDLYFGDLSNSPQDFTVTDAQPAPTSKDDCKHGGWRTFPGFKNEGDCVSFVATGGKNEPSQNPAS